MKKLITKEDIKKAVKETLKEYENIILNGEHIKYVRKHKPKRNNR